MKKTLFDVTDIHEESRFMSIPQYKIRLLESFDETERRVIVLLANKDNSSYIKKILPTFDILEIASNDNKWCKIPIVRHFRKSYIYSKTVNNSGCSSIFIASDLPFYSKGKVRLKKIQVVHDLKEIKQGKIKDRIRRYIEHAITYSNSDLIIPISKYTRNDLLRLFPLIDKNKIKVIYNSINNIKGVKKPTFLIPSSYILWVNTAIEYKNVMTFLKAYNSIKNIEQEIVIVSKEFPYWKDICIPFIKHAGIDDKVHIVSDISDEELRYLYEKADLFVTCSTHEGFGYTPIEAAIYKCPVISTRCEALADTTQNKLYYYEHPFNYNELADKIQFVLKNRPNYKQLEEISVFFKKKYNIKTQKSKIFNLF